MAIKKGLTLEEAFKALNGRMAVKESVPEELFFDIKKINAKIVDIIKEEMDGLILKGATSLSAETADPGLDKIKYVGRSINNLTNSWEYSYILFATSRWFKPDNTFDNRFNIIKERITKVLKEAGIVDFSFNKGFKYYGDRTDLKFSTYYELLVISMPLSTAKINKEREEFIAIQKDLVNDPLSFEGGGDKLSFKEYCTYFDKKIVRDHIDWIEELYDDYLNLIDESLKRKASVKESLGTDLSKLKVKDLKNKTIDLTELGFGYVNYLGIYRGYVVCTYDDAPWARKLDAETLEQSVLEIASWSQGELTEEDIQDIKIINQPISDIVEVKELINIIKNQTV